MKTFIKRFIKDSPLEAYIRWCVKRTRGIRIPYDLVVDEIYDRQAVEIISCVLDSSSNTIDIGCHKGQFLEKFISCAPDGKHFAFEPIPELAQELIKKFPSADIRSCAVSDKSGSATFFVVPEKPARSGLNERAFMSPNLKREAISVSTARLDDLIPQSIRVKLIKIDVEGAEGLVISGGKETIIRNRPYIIFEHGQSSSKAFGTLSGDIYQMIRSCGLEVSTLKGWLRGASPLTAEAFGKVRGWYYLAHPEPKKRA